MTLTKSEITKGFDGNTEFEDIEPEYTVEVSVSFDTPNEADTFVKGVEKMIMSFPRGTSLAKKRMREAEEDDEEE